MDSTERIEHYEELRKEATKHMRYFSISVAGFSVCISVAFNEGSTSGWPWLCGALLFLFGSLWSILDARHFELQIALHLLPENLRHRNLSD